MTTKRKAAKSKLKLQTLTITLQTTLPQRILKRIAKIESVQVTQPGNDR